MCPRGMGRKVEYFKTIEAEWEYAARGGSKSRGYKYDGGNNIGSVAWYDGNSGNKTHEVGKKQPNELDLYDMSGNVWEWCQDWYWDWYGKYGNSFLKIGKKKVPVIALRKGRHWMHRIAKV